jgi:c(7)-type cytochrome triheme protein
MGGINLRRARSIVHAASVMLVAQVIGPTSAPCAERREVAPPEVRLPADVVYDRMVGPDSAVVFSHQIHFALAGNRCTGCHPGLFRILAPTPSPTHREMNAGGSCGTCHDGRQAFGVIDRKSCTSCHVGRPTPERAGRDTLSANPGGPPRARGPKPISYARGESSPGGVTFRHATHLREATACTRCHPKPFAMKSSPPRPAGGMHESAACGSCHDGTTAFATGDPNACARCHVETQGAP